MPQNGQGPLMNVPPFSGANGANTSPIPAQQQNQGQSLDQEKVKQLLAQMTQMMQGGMKQPTAAAPQGAGPKSPSQVQFSGPFGAVMGLISNVKHRKNEETMRMAQSYSKQLFQLLDNTGKSPEDAKQDYDAAMSIMTSNPKVMKTLEEGIGHFQLMAPEAPPSAHGVMAAAQQHTKGNQKQAPQAMRPIIPHGNQMGNLAQMLPMLKQLTDVQGNVASTKQTEVGTQQIQQQIGLAKQTTDANIKNLNASTESTKWKLENDKSLSPLDRTKAENELKIQGAQIKDFESLQRLRDAEASWYASGKVTPQSILSDYKTATSGFDKAISDHEQALKAAQAEFNKLRGYQIQYNVKGIGITADILKTLGFNNMEDFTSKLNQAESMLQSETQKHQKMQQGRQNLIQLQSQVTGGKVSLSQVIIDSYKMGGISIPSDVVSGISANAPSSSNIDDEIMQLVK